MNDVGHPFHVNTLFSVGYLSKDFHETEEEIISCILMFEENHIHPTSFEEIKNSCFIQIILCTYSFKQMGCFMSMVTADVMR